MDLQRILSQAKQSQPETPAGKVQRRCRCGKTFFARQADIKRGWGKYCSKRCKAFAQEARTGQCAAYHARCRAANGERDDSEGFQMSAAELAMGGYGDATNETPFGDGKW